MEKRTILNLIYSKYNEWHIRDMDDYSHCHYFNNERECISMYCDETCRYFREHKTKGIDLSKWIEWEDLFEL